MGRSCRCNVTFRTTAIVRTRRSAQSNQHGRKGYSRRKTPSEGQYLTYRALLENQYGRQTMVIEAFKPKPFSSRVHAWRGGRGSPHRPPTPAIRSQDGPDRFEGYRGIPDPAREDGRGYRQSTARLTGAIGPAKLPLLAQFPTAMPPVGGDCPDHGFPRSRGCNRQGAHLGRQARRTSSRRGIARRSTRRYGRSSENVLSVR